jgi:hypothetical protein
VKLFSSKLLVMAVFLAAPDFGKLFRLLVLSQPAGRVEQFGPLFHNRDWQIVALVSKTLLIAAVLIGHIVTGYQSYQNAVVNPGRPPLYGIYDVESFLWSGSAASDSIQWKSMIVEFPGFARVTTMDDTARSFATRYDVAKNSVAFTTTPPSTLNYARPDADHLVLTGAMANSSLEIKMRRRDRSGFPLLNRGFHWISETPFNR